MSGDEILNYVFAGFVVLLLAMIFMNVLGGPRRPRKRRPSTIANAPDSSGDSSGGVDPGPLIGPRGRGSRWDGSGDNGFGDGGSDGGGGGD